MPRSRIAEVRLEAIAAAKTLHREMGLKSRVQSGEGFIDVFGIIEDLGIPLVFQPLNSALGLCLPRPNRGIMITTQRSLHIQRFTGAHELGHDTLEHSGSIDSVINFRAGLDPGEGQDLQEVAADTFAAEFMLPRWLYKHHIQKQQWTVSRHLNNPDIIYQLSLRMAASFEATCWGLVSHDIVSRNAAQELLKSKVANLKSDAGQQFRPANAWANAWRLSAHDDGDVVLGDSDDLVRLDLDEAAGSGYQWSVEALTEAGFKVLSDQNDIPRDPMNYGATARRTIMLRPPERPSALLALAERRPWLDPGPDDRALCVHLRLNGKEKGGLAHGSLFRPGANTQ
tara:strand:+ start:5383 stop:6405 length:1023 start_codon:yes stop_codon:yes gene_type:complete